jgi:hypothetical protein
VRRPLRTQRARDEAQREQYTERESRYTEDWSLAHNKVKERLALLVTKNCTQTNSAHTYTTH